MVYFDTDDFASLAFYSFIIIHNVILSKVYFVNLSFLIPVVSTVKPNDEVLKIPPSVPHTKPTWQARFKLSQEVSHQPLLSSAYESTAHTLKKGSLFSTEVTMNLITHEPKTILSRHDLTLFDLIHRRAYQRFVRCTNLRETSTIPPRCRVSELSAFLVGKFLQQQGGAAELVDSTFFGNSQTYL